MSRLYGKFTADGEEPLDLADLLATLESTGGRDVAEWRDAITCYLSASEGWMDASRRLAGAFAEEKESRADRTDGEP